MAARRNRNTRRRNRGRFGGLYKLLSVLLIFAAILLGCLVFFRVDRIEVTGASRYSEEEIIQVAGVKQGDNLYGLNKTRIVNQLLTQLPYIDEISISRRPPDTLVINIRESAEMAVLYCEGSYWLLDNRCKVLAQVGERQEGRAEILGLEGLEPAVGALLKVPEEQAGKLESLRDLLSAVRERGMTGSLTSFIDVSSTGKIRFGYGDGLTIVMPMTADYTELTYQLKLALETMDARGLVRQGTLDLSIGERQGNLQPNRWLPGDGETGAPAADETPEPSAAPGPEPDESRRKNENWAEQRR